MHQCYQWQVCNIVFVAVQSRSRVQLFAAPWAAAHQAPLSFTISWSLLNLMSIELVMPANCLILCCPLLLLPSIFLSIRVFSNELALCIWWPKYWNFSISPCNEYSGLISFRINWFDLLAVQGTLRSLLQHYSLKTWILWCSAFFMGVRASNFHIRTLEKSYPWLSWSLWTKWCLCFLIHCLDLSGFLPRSKYLLISCLQWFWRPRK